MRFLATPTLKKQHVQNSFWEAVREWVLYRLACVFASMCLWIFVWTRQEYVPRRWKPLCLSLFVIVAEEEADVSRSPPGSPFIVFSPGLFLGPANRTQRPPRRHQRFSCDSNSGSRTRRVCQFLGKKEFNRWTSVYVFGFVIVFSFSFWIPMNVFFFFFLLVLDFCDKPTRVFVFRDLDFLFYLSKGFVSWTPPISTSVFYCSAEEVV